MRVLSMFDGISCGRVALDRLGIVPEVYFASEIDKYAERVSADNWPDIVRLGDAYGVGGWNLGPVDLLLGGSPCTHWSIAQRNRETESSGLGWELFSLYVKALERYKPRYFLYENVKSMSPAIRDEITRSLGVEPIAINSALVSAQNRERLYWTNIPGVEQPEDRGVYLRDVLESGVTDRDKAYCLLSTYWKENARDYILKAHGQVAFEPVMFQNPHGKNMGGIKYGKAPTVTGPGKYASNNFVIEPAAIASGAAWRGRDPDSRYEVRSDGKSNAVTAEGHQSRLVAIRADGKEAPVYEVADGLIEIRGKQYKINLPDGLYILRKLTATECCRLQTLPDDYCSSVSDSQAYRTVGNGWTVDVIVHILGHMSMKGDCYTMKSLILTAQDARELGNLGGLTITKPIKPAPPVYVEGACIVEHSSGEWLLVGPDGDVAAAEKCGNFYTPPVRPGDAVFIREPWHYRHELNSDEPDAVTLASELSPEEAKGRKWASPVSMPEDAARRFARVVSVGTAYGPGVAPVWLVELEAVDKAAAVAIDAGLPYSTADDEEGRSDYFTYAGDMTPEEHERMVAATDADRARLAAVQDRIVWMKRRRAKIAEELPEAMNEPRTPETKTSRADALRIEDAALADELDELTVEEGNLCAALEDAGAPVQTVEERARERLAELEKRSLEVAQSIADARAADACGTPAELAETREALTREAERLSAEADELATYLSTIEAQPEDATTPASEESATGDTPEGEGAAAEADEEVGSFTLGKCKYCGREWGVTLEGAKGGGYPTQRTADAAATRVCDCEEATTNRAAIVGVALAVTRGACQYCGQLQEVGPHPSQAAADETASEVCNCPRARDERRVRERAEDARERVERLFGDSAEELGFKPVADDAVHLLESVVEMIARGPISSASLNIRGQCKAKFSVTSKGKIKVSRSETRSCDLEAGE